jgi:hypothetical protein
VALAIAQVTQYATTHSQFLQLINENGELTLETQLEFNPLVYVINEDQILQVGRKLWKVLKYGIVEAAIDSTIPVSRDGNLGNDGNTSANLKYYYQILLGITDDNIHSIIGKYPNINYTPYGPSKMQKGKYGRELDVTRETNRKERIKFWAGICDYADYVEYVNRGVELTIISYYRCLGIWWWNKRTANVDISSCVMMGGGTFDYFSVKFNKQINRFSNTYLIKNYPNLADPYFSSASVLIKTSKNTIDFNLQ